MNVFSIQVPIHATLYVRAQDEDEAMRLAREACMDAALEISTRSTGDIEISGLEYADPELPDVSFSPAMTVGEIEDQTPELVEEGVIEDIPAPPAPGQGICINPRPERTVKNEVFYLDDTVEGRDWPALCEGGEPPAVGYYVERDSGFGGPFATAAEASAYR